MAQPNYIACIECSICLSDIEDNEKHTLACGHAFHADCIKLWITKQTSVRCPLCRSQMSDKHAAAIDPQYNARRLAYVLEAIRAYSTVLERHSAAEARAQALYAATATGATATGATTRTIATGATTRTIARNQVVPISISISISASPRPILRGRPDSSPFALCGPFKFIFQSCKNVWQRVVGH